MSATLDEKSIAKYFSCPIVYVKGRNYPVQENYIDDIYRFIAKKTNSTTQVFSYSRHVVVFVLSYPSWDLSIRMPAHQ